MHQRGTCSLRPFARLAAAAILALLAPGSPPARAEAGDTLRLVRDRGVLSCGVGDGVLGFSVRDPAAAGGWSGMDVDFCRAVAAAALGDPGKVRFLPLSATARFPALASREIDVLARATTWSVEREATFSVLFAGVLYLDTQALLVRADGPLARGGPLEGARVCVERGSNQIDDLGDYGAPRGWRFTPVASADFGTSDDEFLAGRCEALTDDRSALAAVLLEAPDPAAYAIRPETISKEPLGPAVRWDDGRWAALVRAVHAVLLDAEERGLTQAQARAAPAGPAAAAGRASYLGLTASTARALGLAPDWALRAVAGVGNYGEMFERDLGSGSRLRLDRGPNRPWAAGGLLYAPPFR